MATQAITARAADIYQGGKAAVLNRLASLQSRTSDLRGEVKVKELALEEAQGVILQMARSKPRVMATPVTIAATTASAYAAGYAQEYLDERKAGKIGPVDAVPLLGFAAAMAAAFFVPDPDLQMAIVGLGQGAAAGGSADAGRAKRRAHKQAMDAQKAAAAATAAPKV